MAVLTLNIGPGSDGDGRKWPKHHYDRNDEYFLERIAEIWIKDLPPSPQPGTTYRLDKLPNGYAGFEKARADSKHVDRYIYGHPNGQFRSLNEFYPHFKHLMDFGDSAGCSCVKCAGTAKKAKDPSERRSKYFAQSGVDAPTANLISPMRQPGTFRKGRYSPDDDQLHRRKDVDFEGTPDVYERLIQRLKDAGSEETVDKMIEEKTSPDWRASSSQLVDTLNAIQALSRCVPRIGEIVMFVRKLDEGESLAWDKGSNTFKRVDVRSNTWKGAPKWEAGVVTQMPQEGVSEKDLATDSHKEQSIVYSGFKVEPLPEPGNAAKPYTRQQKHVPLHVIRPFTLWQECLRDTPEKEWHPTIKHALTVSSSLCVVGKYRFKGIWPNASIFCRGLYLGSELILPGDAVRLLPRSGEQRSSAVTEIMVVTAIRLRFVNLDFDEDDLAPTAPELPYQTAVHISGKVFTTDPSRSFNGVSKTPIDPKTIGLPLGFAVYGPWYHYSNPKFPKARIEVPFSRLLGRCHEHSAIDLFFKTSKDVKTEMQPPAFKPVNAPRAAAEASSAETNLLSKGATAIKDARIYSREQDARLATTEQPWFWADTRIEQLDLHEVNGRFVGVKDGMRTREQLSRWQKALKGLDGKKGALEEYQAARKQRLEEEKASLQSRGGMMGSAMVDTEIESIANGDSANGEAEEDEDDDEGDAMEVDVSEGASKPAQNAAGRIPPRLSDVIDLMDSESEEEMARDQLVGELFKNIRPGGGRA